MALRLRINKEYSGLSGSYIYNTRVVTVGKVDGDDLIGEAAEDSNISKATVYAAAAAIALQFRELLFRGFIVGLTGIGTFRVSGSCDAQDSLDDAGAETLTRRRILYTPDERLREELYKTELETEYGNNTTGVYKKRSAYAAAIGEESTDAATDTGASDS